MDITPLFKACIKTVKSRNRSLGIPIPNPDKQRILKTKPKNEFMKTAKEIVDQITKLRDLLLRNRTAYLSFFNNACDNLMTESERDQIDAGAMRFVNTSLHLLREFRSDHRKDVVPAQMREFMDTVIDLMDAYLKSVCKIHSELKALRVKRALDIRRLSRLEQTNAKPFSTLTITDSIIEKVVTDKEKEAVDSEVSDEVDNNVKTKMHLSENEVAIAEELSVEELQMFESENVQLLNELSTMSEDVKQIESKVLHIAELQEIFTEKILQQEQDIDRISSTVVGATENVKDANEQIKQAIQRNAGLRVYILFFLLVMTFTLLFLDWYND